MADNCRDSTNLIRKRTMKKSELKNIIKECVKEVIFEEGVLSGIITEVAQGLQGAQILTASQQSLGAGNNFSKKSENVINKMTETRKRVQEAMTDLKNAPTPVKKPEFAQKNPLFEGTAPIPEGDGKGSLSGISPSDPGIDISNLPGMGRWGSVAARLKGKEGQ